jgi:hypothetical protein
MGQEKMLEIRMRQKGQAENQECRLIIKKMGEPEMEFNNTPIKGTLIINLI